MATRLNTSVSLLLFQLVLVLFCLWNISFVPDRATVPFRVAGVDGRVVVISVDDAGRAGGIRPGDILSSWKQLGIAQPEHLELLADLSRIGDRVPLTIQRDGRQSLHSVELVPFYPSYRFAVVMGVAGMTLFILALFVYLRRPNDPTALLLHWALLSLAALVMMTQGAISAGDLLSALRRSLLFLSYNLTAAFFLLFTARFPRRLLPSPRTVIPAVLAGFIVFAGVLSALHSAAMNTGLPEHFIVFQDLYDVFHFVFLVVLAVGILLIFLGYLSEQVPDRRTALRWIYYGLLVGAAPFLLLVVLPQLWGPDMFVPEELAVVFTLAIPLSFIVAFLRFNVFSIQIQHHQRLSTFLLRFAASLLQVLFAAVVLSIVWEDVVFGTHVVETFVFGFVLLGLVPLQRSLVEFVEEAIYPARQNPGRILKESAVRLSDVLIESEVGPLIVRDVGAVIPRFRFEWYRWTGRVLLRSAHGLPGSLGTLSLPPHVIDDVHHGRVLTEPGAVRTDASRSTRPQVEWLQHNGLSLMVPLRTETHSLLGAVCARRNDGADPLDAGELELVLALSSQAAASIERLRLQETMILEQRKRRELEELSRLKSHFVSSVSHDLRTPLTSMSMFVEMLGQRNLRTTLRNEYIGFIRLETERLRRLVENVLDFSKAERGAQEFAFERCDLVRTLRSAADALSGQFKAVGASFTVRIPRRLPPVWGDADALERSFVNLLSNAFKYTTGHKKVSFTARRQGSSVQISVRDNGVGIEPRELPKIFDPFYRVRDADTRSSGGVGLGLSLVKRTIERHGGTISIRSRPGKGSTVTVVLPVMTTTSDKGQHS